MTRFRNVWWVRIYDLPLDEEYKKKLVMLGRRLRRQMRKVDRQEKKDLNEVFSIRTTFNTLVVETTNLAQLGVETDKDKPLIMRIKEDIRKIHKELNDHEKKELKSGISISRAKVAAYFGLIESVATSYYHSIMEAGLKAPQVKSKDTIQRKFLYAFWDAVIRRSEMLTPSTRKDKDGLILDKTKELEVESEKSELGSAFDAVTGDDGGDEK